MTPEDMRYFGVQLAPLFGKMSPEALSYLQKVRPDCPWDEWQRQSAQR